jgi:hypothetical protein
MAVFGRRRLTRTGLLFVIGIIVLGGLVTGGIFLVKNHGEAVRRDQAVKIAEANLKDQSKQPTSTQPVTTGTSSTPDSSQTTGSGTGTGTGSGATTTAAAPGGPNTTSTSTSPTSNPDTSTNGTSNASSLPVTGPNDLQSLGRTIIIAIVAFSVAFYVSSRRTVRTR